MAGGFARVAAPSAKSTRSSAPAFRSSAKVAAFPARPSQSSARMAASSARVAQSSAKASRSSAHVAAASARRVPGSAEWLQVTEFKLFSLGRRPVVKFRQFCVFSSRPSPHPPALRFGAVEMESRRSEAKTEREGETPAASWEIPVTGLAGLPANPAGSAAA